MPEDKRGKTLMVDPLFVLYVILWWLGNIVTINLLCSRYIPIAIGTLELTLKPLTRKNKTIFHLTTKVDVSPQNSPLYYYILVKTQ